MWRREQDERIAQLADPDDRQEARIALLQQQTKSGLPGLLGRQFVTFLPMTPRVCVCVFVSVALSLFRGVSRYLSAMEQLKLLADEGNRERRIARFLEDAATPRQWNNTEYGMSVAMETPSIQRARQLRDIYLLLFMPDLEMDERLDALLQLKAVVDEFSSDSLCREILELIQREAELIGRGARDTVLHGTRPCCGGPGALRAHPRRAAGLRRRLLNLFLQFAETPKYNPEAARLLLVHQDKAFFRENMARAAGTDVFATKRDFAISPQLTAGIGLGGLGRRPCLR